MRLFKAWDATILNLIHNESRPPWWSAFYAL